MTGFDQACGPSACTLPTAARPLRMAEFDALLATGLRRQQRVSPTRLRWHLDPDVEAAARSLTAREAECCSFFSFFVTPGTGTLQLDIVVPPAQTPVLDALSLSAQAETTVLRSSQVAAAAGVNLQTLRYYERRGLLAEPNRTLGGHRLYPPETVTTVRVIKAAQRLGFTLDEVTTLLHGRRPGPTAGTTPGTPAGRSRRRPDTGRPGPRPATAQPDTGLRDQARAKLAEVEAKISDLHAIAESLRAAVDAGCADLAACAGEPSCPIPFATVGPA